MSYTKEKRPAEPAGGPLEDAAIEAGPDKVQASHDHGRRWYHLRPQPRGRADFMGFNRSWWTILLLIVLAIL